MNFLIYELLSCWVLKYTDKKFLADFYIFFFKFNPVIL